MNKQTNKIFDIHYGSSCAHTAIQEPIKLARIYVHNIIASQ